MAAYQRYSGFPRYRAVRWRQPDEAAIFEAAAIAAYHSKARGSENVPVDYVPVKYVKKPAGAKPGMVIFTHNKTLYVDPALPGPDHTAEK